MYQDHPEFTVPAAPGLKIYQYMSLIRFDDLLRSRKLWFARADQLGDPLEGSCTEVDRQIRRKVFSRLDPRVGPRLIDHQSLVNEAMTKLIFVNCWYTGRHESSLMWSRYTPDGVVVQATVERLQQALTDTPFGKPIHIGHVTYRDFTSENVVPGEYSYVLNKDIAYTGESELRALFSIKDEHPNLDQPPEKGFGVPIDLDALLEGVIARQVSCRTAQDLLQANGLDREVTPSRLDLPPRY